MEHISTLDESDAEKFHTLYRSLLKLCKRVSPQIYDGRLSSVQDFMLEVNAFFSIHDIT